MKAVFKNNDFDNYEVDYGPIQNIRLEDVAVVISRHQDGSEPICIANRVYEPSLGFVFEPTHRTIKQTYRTLVLQ